MKKLVPVAAFLFIFIALGVLNSGCMTTKSNIKPVELSGKQKAQAEDWLHSASLLYKIGDYDFALEYYKKLVEYYPGTKYAIEARNKISKIENAKQ